MGVLQPAGMHHINGCLPDRVARDTGKLAVCHALARPLQRGKKQFALSEPKLAMRSGALEQTVVCAA